MSSLCRSVANLPFFWLPAISPLLSAHNHLQHHPQAGARLCKALGPEFLPYLNIVMPPLLKTAALEPDVKVGGRALRIILHRHG